MIAGLDFISLFGISLIAIAFISAVVSTSAFGFYHKDRIDSLYTLAIRSYALMTIGILLSMALLVYSILTHDFQMNYVYSYSSVSLNKFYLFSTLWAGQEGTFLMWLMYGSIFGAIFIRKNGKKHPLVLLFLLLVQAFLLLILLKKNPFSMIWHTFPEPPIGFTPTDGAGLNPLLQNPWMVIHPPTLFVGYSSTVMPFAIAMAAMVTRDYQGWVQRAKPWIIFNVMILGTGIVMGGYWAYVTLGWGGYWAWDPVENASLVPWLFSVVLLHGVVIQSKRKSLVRSNFALAGGSFLAMVWGSFLTRSGALTDFSVHSFAPSGLSFYLIMFQVLFTALFVIAFVKTLSSLRADKVNIPTFGEGLVNRETFMLMGMLILALNALVILFGTSAPLYTSWLVGDAASLSPDFYNSMIMPTAIFMMLVVGIAPLLAWKTSEFRNRNTALMSAGAALLVTVIAVLLGLQGMASVTLFFFSAFVIIINSRVALLFLKRNAPKAGGYLSHVGVGFMVIGILISSVYDSSEKVLLPEGEFREIGLSGYQIQFSGFREMPDGKDRVELEVKLAGGKSYTALPQFYYSDYSKSYMVSPDVKVAFARDIYISPISFTPAEFANLNTFELGKNQSTVLGDIEIVFNDFEVTMGANQQEVVADLEVTVLENGYKNTSTVRPKVIASDGGMDSQPADVPDSFYKIKIASVDASAGKVQLSLLQPEMDTDAAKDMMAIEVTEKPLISVLWFGTILFIIGSFLSLINRRKNRTPTA